jgi:hypothetical protein
MDGADVLLVFLFKFQNNFCSNIFILITINNMDPQISLNFIFFNRV